MLDFKGSAGVTPEVNQRNSLHTGKKACKWGIHCGTTKMTDIVQKFLFKSGNEVSILIWIRPLLVELQWQVDPYQKWREKCFSALDFILFVYPAKLDEERDFTNPIHDILLFSSGTIWVNMPRPVSFSRNSGFHFIWEISRKTKFLFFKPGKKPSHYVDL